MKKYKVIFQPSGRRGEINDGATVLDAARLLGAGLESICGGKGICGKCKVRVEEGEFREDAVDSKMSHLSGLTDAERKFITLSDGPGTRLACLCQVHGDVEIFVPEASRAGRQLVRKGAREVSVDVLPAVRKYFVQLAPPSLQDMGEGDRERLQNALREQYGLSHISVDYVVLKGIQDTLRKGEWNVTVTVWSGTEIVKLEPGFAPSAYGLAVDVGTTTVAGYLCDLTTGKVVATESAVNPQVVCGEDVMSRITYAMSNPDGLAIMQTAIRDCINGIIGRLAGGIGGGQSIIDMTVVCNTVMHHIFLGINPANIGVAPFVPGVERPVNVKARELGIDMNPSSYIHVLPVVAGFVGPDNVGVLIAEEPYKLDEKVLIIDIGTNGELLLGNKDGVSSASCATGPAFEGAQIKFGMRATPGAIEGVKIDRQTKEPLLNVIGGRSHDVKPKGICGSGVIDAVAGLFKAGIIDKTGRFVMGLNTERIRRDAGGKPEYVLAWKNETALETDITVTQADVRAVQLAKGALYAGAKLLMRKMGMEKVDKVILAGAFGSYINKESALTLGMFPDCALENIYAVGNAAGDGAVMALVNIGKREEAEREARKLKYVEIAMEPDFQEEFLAAMDIPHTRDEFPNPI
ncbi:MAG: ASKHA domain-containing protein [Nitrospirota bacterium]